MGNLHLCVDTEVMHTNDRNSSVALAFALQDHYVHHRPCAPLTRMHHGPSYHLLCFHIICWMHPSLDRGKIHLRILFLHSSVTRCFCRSVLSDPSTIRSIGTLCFDGGLCSEGLSAFCDDGLSTDARIFRSVHGSLRRWIWRRRRRQFQHLSTCARDTLPCWFRGL